MRAAVVVLALGACGFRPTLAGDDGGTGSDSADAPIDQAITMPPGPCGSPGAIRDDFNDGMTGSQWSRSASGTLAEQGGRFAASPVDATYSGYVSKHYVDLTGSLIQVEVPAMVDTSTNAVAELLAENDGTHYHAIFQMMGQLYALTNDGGVKNVINVPYDPVAHHWWRIREASGTVSFETSPDATAWTAFHTVTTPTWITAVRIDIGTTVGSPATPGPYGTAAFDNLNTNLAPVGWCQADTLHDTFQRSTFGTQWQNRKAPAGCTETMSFGAHTDQSGTTSNDCYFGSSAAFSLTNSSFVLDISAITNYTAGWVTYISANAEGGGKVELYFDQDQICGESGTSAQVAVCRAYSTAESYWRIREASGHVYFEMSTDQTTWNPVHSIPDPPFSLDNLELRFGTTSTVTGSSIGLTFSSFN